MQTELFSKCLAVIAQLLTHQMPCKLLRGRRKFSLLPPLEEIFLFILTFLNTRPHNIVKKDSLQTV